MPELEIAAVTKWAELITKQNCEEQCTQRRENVFALSKVESLHVKRKSYHALKRGFSFSHLFAFSSRKVGSPINRDKDFRARLFLQDVL